MSSKYRRRDKIIERIRNNIKELNEKKENKPKVILLATGSYNPIHKMHVNVFNLVKSQLSSRFNIVAALLSPSHDEYLLYKFYSEKKSILNLDTRLTLAEYEVENSGLFDFLFVDDWEGLQSGFKDFPKIVDNVRDMCNLEFGKEIDLVIYISGYDHFLNCNSGPLANKKGVGVAVVERPGYSNSSFDESCNVKTERVYFIKSDLDFDVSSTKVREMFSKKDYVKLKEHMCKKSIDYLVEKEYLT